jgi:hypothetical protein
MKPESILTLIEKIVQAAKIVLEEAKQKKKPKEEKPK